MSTVPNVGSTQNKSTVKSEPLLDFDAPPMLDTPREEIREAFQIVIQSRRATTANLQRRMRIGYIRASLLLDELEQRGIVGPPKGIEPREIFVKSNVPADFAGVRDGKIQPVVGRVEGENNEM